VLYQHQQTTYQVKRPSFSQNKSLKPWNAADEYLIQFFDELDYHDTTIAVCNDAFGLLTCYFNTQCYSIVNNKSQENTIKSNLDSNAIPFQQERFLSPLDSLPTSIDYGLLKIPKSLELFELYLSQLSAALRSDGVLVCAFMTKYFTPAILEIADRFFDDVSQSKAQKKARLLLLKGVKATQETLPLIHSIDCPPFPPLKQYYGVFSAKHIDYASQFLIEHINLKDSDQTVLDLASGNGVLASRIRHLNPHCKLHLLDDSFLAIASSKMNLEANNTTFYHQDNLAHFETNYFDYVISNPPFHFEYEINISIPLRLFKEVHRCLKDTGCFQLVANKHLNYKTHLSKLFSKVVIDAENNKFVIYSCYK